VSVADPRGLKVNGFVVVETLGSGRAGLLSLARPLAVQEAIIRLASEGRQRGLRAGFLEEASSLPPHACEVATEYADFRGLAVQLLRRMQIVDPLTRQPF